MAGEYDNRSLLPAKVLLHWLEVKVDPTLPVVVALSFRDVRMIEGHAGAITGGFDKHFQFGIFGVVGELAGAPRLYDAAMRLHLEGCTPDVAIPRRELAANSGLDGCGAAREA